MNAAIIIAAAKSASIPAYLLAAVCAVESNHTSTINIHDGGSPSYGACQLKVNTARLYDRKATGAKLLNYAYNADIAARYLRTQLDRYHGNTECAIAAYNAGTCKFNDRKQIRNRKYVKKVKARFNWARTNLYLNN